MDNQKDVSPYLKCMECGWVGTQETAYHFSEEETLALADIIYREAFIFGRYWKVLNLRQFIVRGGHACPNTECEGRFVFDLRVHNNNQK